jgi:hypothetical protein
MVLLIGGHSGAGKSTLAAQVARRAGTALVEADDVRMAIQRVTAAEHLPALHFFASAPGVARPGIWQRDLDELVRGLIGVAEIVSRALGPVVGHHVAAGKPVVVEGDGILPSLAAQDPAGWNLPDGAFPTRATAGAVRSVYLIEPGVDVGRQRMGPGPDGDTKAAMHWRYGQWLRAEAERYRQPVVPPRPYATLLGRVLTLVGGRAPTAERS